MTDLSVHFQMIAVLPFGMIDDHLFGMTGAVIYDKPLLPHFGLRGGNLPLIITKKNSIFFII